MPLLRSIRRVLILVVVLAAAAAAFYYWKTHRPEEKPAYRTDAVGRGDIAMTVTATGTLSAVTTVKVGSQVSGIVSHLYADFNSRVEKGQLLAELDPTPFAATVEQRQADLAQAEAQERNSSIAYDRQKRLLAVNLVSQGDYDSAHAAHDQDVARVSQATAALAQARTNLGYTKIVSPISGVVVDRQYDVGQTVAASFQAPTLFTIAQDLTRMQVQADVDQSDIGRVQVGQVARFTVDAFPDQEFRGSITQIRLNATVSQNVITYPVILEVANPGEKLRPQMTADITIEVAKVRDVLRIANAALRFRPPESAVGGGAPAGAGRGAQAAEQRSANSGAAPTGPRDGATGAGGTDRRAGRPGGAAAPSPAGGWPGAGGPRSERGKERHEQTVYVLADGGELKPVAIRTGITDGKYTEVVGGDLKPGDKVVTGLPTAKVEQTGRPPGMGRF